LEACMAANSDFSHCALPLSPLRASGGRCTLPTSTWVDSIVKLLSMSARTQRFSPIWSGQRKHGKRSAQKPCVKYQMLAL